ncbi:MAG: glutamate-semialdehyde -aminomutase [Thermoleophilaceae bacterium]|jgi:glutamate-1-semialdehyde 2,1-aminomutase|nr:glutamate-semialdehyde -aminomutase [Thermoleophilaceae bacterium]
MTRVNSHAGTTLLPGSTLTSAGLRPERTVLARGSGARVWDDQGRQYIDYLLGSGPLLLGHAHPAVVEAVQRQAALGSTFYTLNEPVLQLAELLVAGIPCAESIQFCSSGGEATGYALRIARAATGRDAILKFEGGFHGANDYGVMSLFPTERRAFPSPEPMSAGVPRCLEDEVLVAPFNDLAMVTELAGRHADRLAAIIVEPVQRAIPPEPGFLEGLRKLADVHGIVLIFDEVVTGFRLAPGGAQEFYGVIPDLATYGKVIGGGYPLAAVAGGRALLELTAPGRTAADGFVYINGTLNGNPVAAAAGMATLEQLGEDAYDRLHELGETVRAQMQEALVSCGLSAQVIGVGPLFQAFLTDTRPVDYRGGADADSATMSSIALEAFDRGIMMSGGKGYISLAHTDEDVDQSIDAFRAAAEAVSG